MSATPVIALSELMVLKQIVPQVSLYEHAQLVDIQDFERKSHSTKFVPAGT